MSTLFLNSIRYGRTPTVVFVTNASVASVASHVTDFVAESHRLSLF
jgi:hypothetical protein